MDTLSVPNDAVGFASVVTQPIGRRRFAPLAKLQRPFRKGRGVISIVLR